MSRLTASDHTSTAGHRYHITICPQLLAALSCFGACLRCFPKDVWICNVITVAFVCICAKVSAVNVVRPKLHTLQPEAWAFYRSSSGNYGPLSSVCVGRKVLQYWRDEGITAWCGAELVFGLKLNVVRSPSVSYLQNGIHQQNNEDTPNGLTDEPKN